MGSLKREGPAKRACFHRHAVRNQASEMSVGERRGSGAHSCEH
ncbi:MAG: hypothetical protein ACK56F_20780 [bacterium]